MNKLKTKIEKVVDGVYSFSPYDTNRECQIAKNNSKIVDDIHTMFVSTITEFFNYTEECGYLRVKDGWVFNIEDDTISDEEIVQRFINDNRV